MDVLRNRAAALIGIALLPLATACSRTTTTATTPAGTVTGAAAAPVTNENRVHATSPHPVAHLATATEAAFRELGITLTEREPDDGGLELEGTEGQWKVEVDLERDDDDPETRIQIEFRDGATMDRARAQRLLNAILTHANR